MKHAVCISTLVVAASALPQFGGFGNFGGFFGGFGRIAAADADPSGCSEFEVLYARGTSEPGTFGTIVGDPLNQRVNSQLDGARGYAVQACILSPTPIQTILTLAPQYPASASSNSVSQGVADAVQRLNSQSQACPDQTFALVGYSQGAMVMHGVFGSGAGLDASVLPKIKSLAMFGDPFLRSSFGSSFPEGIPLQQNCAGGDPICDRDAGSFTNHLAYRQASFQDSAAEFIVSNFQME